MNRTRTATGAAVALIIMLLAGCTASQQTTAETPTPSPTASAESSTVAQWASLISRQQAEWEDWEDTWDEATCSALYANTEQGVLCRLQLTAASVMTQTTSLEYQIAVKPGTNGFIATRQPAEIAGLFAGTAQSANDAFAASQAWTDAGCGTAVSDQCGALGVSLERSVSSLLSAFDGWGPYL